MTNLLVKAFIHNADDVRNPGVREKYGMLSGSVGIICNLSLFIAKLIIGVLINSISVMADAFNNLSDAASAIVSFVGAKLSNRPADEEHPFGHGRYEYIAALVVAFLVFQVGFSCLKSSVEKIQCPEFVAFSPILVGVLVLSILLKLWLGFFNRKLGNKIDSTVMRATSTDAFGDVVITSATVISILIGALTGWEIDGYMGLLVSLFVLYAGIGIVRETLEPLLGQAATPELYNQITKFVEKYEGIMGSHDLIIHNYGPSNTMATIHAEVSKDSEMEQIHEVIDRIERDAKRELNIFLVIHMDPVEIDNDQIDELKMFVISVVDELEPEASIHDFRVVNGEEQVNLIFDLVIPYEYKGEDRQNLIEKIKRDICRKDARFQCIITVEHSFVKR